MLMWGQPPSAVQASEVAFLARKEIPNLEYFLSNFSKLFKLTASAVLQSRPAELRSADSRGRLSPPNAFMPQAFYRRQLPHLQVDDRQHFVTFCTDHRWILPPQVRSLVLDSCLHDNVKKLDLKVAVVMPDHVHLIFTALIDHQAMEVWSLARIMDAIKGASAHRINDALGRKGRVWQAESFDHVLRSSESLDAKVQYLLDNPVRQGLAREWQNIPGFGESPSKTHLLRLCNSDLGIAAAVPVPVVKMFLN